MSYSFQRLGDAPVLDRPPHHLRMATAYHDKVGRTHLFSDVIEAEQGTGASWGARISYFSSDDLGDWKDHGIVIDRGDKAKDRSVDPFDVFGAASPHVLALGDKIILAYAGRGSVRFGEAADGRSLPGEAGYISGLIGLAVADADDAGAPVLPFKKLGPITRLGKTFDRTRHDDPCLVLDGETLYLYYKVIGDRAMESRKLARVKAKTDDLNFAPPSAPIFEIPGRAGDAPGLQGWTGVAYVPALF